MVIIRRDSAFMFGNGAVQYGDIKLDAAEIQMDLNDNTVFAVGRYSTPRARSSAGPYSTTRAPAMRPRLCATTLNQRKATSPMWSRSRERATSQADSPKEWRGRVFPHQWPLHHLRPPRRPPLLFPAHQGPKVRPGKNAVFGPAYMVLAGLPLPLAVPFGYFPFTDKYASGIIVPSFGDDYNRGFYLSDGGYYFAINDNIDLALTGEIYTKGSWGPQRTLELCQALQVPRRVQPQLPQDHNRRERFSRPCPQTNFQVLWSHCGMPRPTRTCRSRRA